MRIEDKYIRMGYFWLPEKEDRKIPGTLNIFDGGKIELEVIGVFDESIESLNGDDDLKRIVGYIEKDGFVTLDSCFYLKKIISFGSISKSKIYVNRVLSGIAYGKDENITFNSLSFSVDCFDDWVGISGIKSDTNYENNIATIEYNLPETIVHSLNNGMELEISFVYFPPISQNITEVKITQTAYFKLKSTILRPLDDFIEIAHKLNDLMCFAIDETVALKKMVAQSSKIQRQVGEKSYLIPIHIYYQSYTFSEKIPSKNSLQMLFNYKLIVSNAEAIFNNWIDAYETISPALSLYFSTKIGAQKYLDGKFLALAQGLETYHRRTSDEKLMDQTQFDSLVSAILTHCPDEHLEWLKGRLTYGNEINLRKRLKLIIEPFKSRFGNSNERKNLLAKIVDTRNYFTHYNDDLKDNAAKGKELLKLCRKMEVIFQLHFLKVIGFTDAEIDSVVENNYSLKQKINEV